MHSRAAIVRFVENYAQSQSNKRLKQNGTINDNNLTVTTNGFQRIVHNTIFQLLVWADNRFSLYVRVAARIVCK